MTRGSSVRGARGGGSARSSRLTSRSRSAGSMAHSRRRAPRRLPVYYFPQRFAPAMNVCLHLGERHAERGGDLLVADFLEVEQHEGHALVRRQRAKRQLEPLALVRPFHLQRRRRLSRRADVVRSLDVRVVGAGQLAEETPSRPVPRQVVEARVLRDGLQPAGRGGTRSDLVEPLKCLQEHLLCHVFRLRRLAKQPDRGSKHHVLVSADEHLERVSVRHARDEAHRRSLPNEPRSAWKVAGETGWGKYNKKARLRGNRASWRLLTRVR